MEFIYTDSNGIDVGYLPDSCTLDMEVGGTNDFELLIPISLYSSFGTFGYIYAEGTEYGGYFCNPYIDDEEMTVSYEGRTFRGMLEDRYIVTIGDITYIDEDLNTMSRSIIAQHFNSVMAVPDEDFGVTYSGKILRNESILKVLNNAWGTSNRKVKIIANGSVDGLAVLVEPTSINDLTDEVEFSSDCGVHAKLKKVSVLKNNYLALGSGQLSQRMIKRYHIDEATGNLQTIAGIFPKNVPVIRFDYPNAEDEDALKQAVMEDYKKQEKDSVSIELNSEEMDRLNAEIEIGDIVGGVEWFTGNQISAPITKKTIKHENGMTTIESKVGEN